MLAVRVQRQPDRAGRASHRSRPACAGVARSTACRPRPRHDTVWRYVDPCTAIDAAAWLLGTRRLAGERCRDVIEEGVQCARRNIGLSYVQRRRELVADVRFTDLDGIGGGLARP